MVVSRTHLDFKELQSSWSSVLSRFPNCPWLGPNGSAPGRTRGALLTISSEPCYCTVAERNLNKAGFGTASRDKYLHLHIYNWLLTSQLSLSSIIFWVLDLFCLGRPSTLHTDPLNCDQFWLYHFSCARQTRLIQFSCFCSLPDCCLNFVQLVLGLCLFVSFSCRKQDWAN